MAIGPVLVEVAADNSTPIVPGQIRDVAPRELVFRFDVGQVINPSSTNLFGIQVTRSGDGIFGNGNDIDVDPLRSLTGAFPNGFLGIGDRPNEVVMRFGEVLPDDFYRITIFGSGPNALRNTVGDPFNMGVDAVIDFRLALGAQVTAVVPQPVTRDVSGVLQQSRNVIEVYFNNDDLNQSDAQDPDFYHLIFTNSTATNTDDVIYHPTTVSYNSSLDKATLTFADSLELLGSGAGVFRLRIGSADAPASAAATEVPLAVNNPADAGSSYATAVNLTPINPLNRQGQIVSGVIEAQPYGLMLPGSNSEPGHREISAEDHLDPSRHNSNTSDTTDGITTIYYDFRQDYGVDPTGNQLLNVITATQKQRAREVLEFYAHFLGVQFVETNPAPNTPSIGFTIVTGDLRAVNPTASTGPTDGIFGIAGPPNIPVRPNGTPFQVNSIALAIMDNAESWGSSEFGGNWFREAMREIGQLLGYGLGTELPDITLNQDNLLQVGAVNTVEPVFPGDHDIVHGQYLYRPESKDIDLYRFHLTDTGTFRAETFAERLAPSSLLDSVVTLFGEVRTLTVPTAGGAGITDGDTFVLDDGVHAAVTFEFDDGSSGGVSPGNVAILFAPLDTADTIAQAIAGAIADVPSLGIEGVAQFNRVELRGAVSASVALAPSLTLTVAQEKIASNDDYYSEDSFLELHLGPGVYYVGVTSRGNSEYDPTISDSGFGGTTQGAYQLRVNFTPDASDTLTDVDGTPLDGDVDGAPGGDFNFWFQVSLAANTLYVDKANDLNPAAVEGDGSLVNPFDNIQSALNTANARNTDANPNNDVRVIRIAANGGQDGLITTINDNRAYAIGVNTNGQPLPDGTTFDVPRNVTVMIDPGAILKMRLANVDVGSSAQNIDRSLGHLQVLGIPGQDVIFTSALDETIGTDVTPIASVAAGGNWGGIVIRSDLDYAEGRPVLEQQGIFMNYVNHADIRYGGGDVQVNSVTQRFTPIHLVKSRPTISYNTITRSADAAMSADPNSFADTRFEGVDFTADYERIGPHIRRNTLAVRQPNGSVAQNSVNGLFVRIRTQAGQPLDVLDVSARWDDADIPHILAENLIIRGTPEGAALSGTELTGLTGLAAEEAIPGTSSNDTIATAVNTTLPLVAPGQYRTFRDSGIIGDNPSLTINPDFDRDVDFFRVDLAAGSRLTVNVNVLHDPLDLIPTLDANLRLFDSAGNELAFSESTPSGTELYFGANVDPYIEFVARTAGTYYVAIAGSDNRSYNPTVQGSGSSSGVFSVGEYDIEISVSAAAADLDARLRIDPGLLVKAAGSRFETGIGAQLIVEGDADRPIVFTSLRDDRYGGGGTFDTNADQSNTFTSPGDWGGFFLGHLSQGSFDHVLVTFAGGRTRIEGNFDQFNALEIHQAEARVTNSIFEDNAAGLATTLRNGRAENAAATIFVRGAQPILVNNIIRDGLGTAISINANAMQWQPNVDWGRTTGLSREFDEFDGNQGPLVRENQMANNAINGMEIRGATLTTQTVWDDTDIVHVLRNQIIIPDHHVYSGLRLQSSATESLVVKLSGANAGFTATGVALDINDRIGGSVQVAGTVAHPVVLTGLGDDTIGAGFDPDGNALLDTTPGQPNNQAPGQWRSIQLLRYSNDRNVETSYESEATHTNGVDINGFPAKAQFLGQLAPDQKSGDENRRLGFEVRGTIAFDSPNDVDVYSFAAVPGSEVWLDLDRSTQALDTVLELVDAVGNVIARSDNSDAERQNPALFAGLLPGNLARSLQRDAFNGHDVYTENVRDAGLRVLLPGAAGVEQTYFVRIYSKNSVETGNPTPNPFAVGVGDTSGHYQLQVRLQEADEVPGSAVSYSDIRFATNGIQVLGAPGHSPLIGDTVELPNDAGNEGQGNALDLGNLLQSDLGSFAISGAMGTATDVDWYEFTVDYDQIDFEQGLRTISLTFDMDYADGIARPDTVISVFDSTGRLVLVARDSDILDDQPGPTVELGTPDVSRGTFGKLDPFIGPQQFPAGQTSVGLTQRYFVAVSSNAQLPTALNMTYHAAANSPLIRLEPVTGVRRIAEDHIGFQGFTSGEVTTDPTTSSEIDPVTPLFNTEDSIGLEANVKPFTLADVPLYISSNFDIAVYNGNTGFLETSYNNPLPNFADPIEDIDFRSDGRLLGYASAISANNQNNAGRVFEFDTATGNQGGIGGLDDIKDATVNTSQVDAMVAERTGANAAGVAQYNFNYFSVRDPNFFTPFSYLFDANATFDADVTGGNARGLIGPIMVSTPGDIGVTTGLALDQSLFGFGFGTMYGVTDQGHFVEISLFDGSATILASLPGFEFQGLTPGPQNMDFNQDGVYGDFQDSYFAITTNGEMVCFEVDNTTFPATARQIPVFDSNGDGVLENVLQTDAFQATGLAFSPVDFNLWHPTTHRRLDAGHGINSSFDLNRFSPGTAPRDVLTDFDARPQFENQGGASMYFGLETWAQNPFPNDYINYSYQTESGAFGFADAQYGILQTSDHRDLIAAGFGGDNYNLPGGAKGSLQTNSFSLAGYAATDKPTLYFNYFLSTENTNSLTGLMRDSARVLVSANGGLTWTMLATNNGDGNGDPGAAFRTAGSELPFFASANSNVDSNPATFDERQRVQELFDNTGGWRQARVDLGEFAGQSDLLIRFDFSSAGTMNEGVPGDEFGTYNDERRFQNNTAEGFFIDDVIIGFAERGEMVTNSGAGATGMFQVPVNPNAAAPEEVLTGDYQLEIRAGTEYGANVYVDASPIIIGPSVSYPDGLVMDTNERLTQGFTILAPQPERFTQTIEQVNNLFAPNVLSFPFNTVVPPTGGGVLTITAVGDLAATNEFLSINGENIIAQNLFITGGQFYTPVTTTIQLSQAQLTQLIADGVVNFTVTPSINVQDFLLPTSLQMTLSYAVGATAPDGETVSINDGLTNIVFEFDSAGGVRPGNVPIPFLRTDSAATIAATIANVINAANFDVAATVTPTSNRVNLHGAAFVNTASAFDVSVNVNAVNVRENGPSTTATVHRDGPTTTAVLVQVTAIDPATGLPSDEINLNGTGGATANILIPAGASQSAAFSVAARDDALVDLTQTAILVPTLANFNAVGAPIDITDDEPGQITITINQPSIAENAGPAAAIGTVTLNIPAQQDLLVTLTSSDSTEAVGPGTVLIPAGQTSITFNIDAVPDFVADGPRLVTFSGSAVGYLSGFNTVTVNDLGFSLPVLPFVGANVNASHSPAHESEPAVMINPTNPANLFMFSNRQPGNGMLAAVSMDSGATWTTRGFGDGTDGLTPACCDPAGSFDRFGNLFITYLGNNLNEIVVAMSIDGGLTFSQLTILDTFGDQPDLSVGSDSVWVYFDNGNAIAAAGAPITGFGVVGAFSAPQVAPGSNFGQGFGDVVVGPNGEVAVTYQQKGPLNGPGNLISINVDPDGLGPFGFGPAVVVTTTNVGGFDDIPPQPFRTVDAEVALEWDRSGGPNNGRLYMVYTDEFPNESGDTDILLRYSDDSGQSWTPPIRINDDNTTNSQFMPQIAIDQTSGFIAVSWYDSRNDDGSFGPGDLNGIPNNDAQYWGTFSSDGGQSFFPNFQISAGTSNGIASGNFNEFGDYSALDFHNGVFYPMWADNSGTAGNDQGLPSLEIYTAQVALAPLLGEITLDILAPAINEAGPGNSTTFTVSRTGDLTNPLTVFLNVLNGGELGTLGTVAQSVSTTVFSGDLALSSTDDIYNGRQIRFTSGALAGQVSTVVDYVGATRTFTLAPALSAAPGVGDSFIISGVPTSIVIPAGDSVSAPVLITAADDLLANGGLAVVILPSAQGYDASSDSVVVQDNDLPALTLVIDPPGQIENDDGPAAIFATITRNTPATTDLVVNITSHDRSEVQVPFTVTIPAGATSAIFAIDAFLEFGLDGTQTVGITASAPGYISGRDKLDVLESPSFEVYDRFGDGNITRPQGQVILHSNRISSASQFGIVVDAGPRDGNNNKPHPGAVRNTREINIERWVPSVVIENNVIVTNGQGGISFSGDPNAGNIPQSAIPFGRIINNTIFGSVAGNPAGVGIQVFDNASPTVLNNIVSRLNVGVSISNDSDTTVLGGTLYFQNATNANTPATIGLGSFDLDLDILSPLIPLFRNPALGDFTLVEGSLAIDSSIDSLADRPEMVAVTQPLGIAASPILAPELDALGRLRIDNPLVASPPGLGFNVFKDRGALERLDPVTIGVDDITITEGTGGTTFAVFNVALSEVLSIPFSVTISTSDGTASQISDYSPTAAILTFQPGQSTQLISVVVFSDPMDEDDETFFLNLSSPTAGAALLNARGTATILDDDGPPSIFVTDQSVFEGDAGLVNVVLIVSLSAPSGRLVSIDYSTANGTASNVNDYVSAAGTITFTPGISTAALTMQTRGDKFVENDETFFLNLANPVNASLGVSQAVITIIDDDAQINISDVTVGEGNLVGNDAVFNVTLSKPASSTVTVVFTTANATAAAGADYTGTTGTLTFAPFEVSKTVTVRVLADSLDEANETFFVNLTNVNNAVLGDSQGIGTIVDDDPPPTVTISPSSVIDPERDTGDTTQAIFLVTLSAVSGQQVFVQYNTLNGPPATGATAGFDYNAVNSTVTFFPGITQQAISVTVLGDNLAEVNETFSVVLSNATNANISAGQNAGTATIVDDEPRVFINDVVIAEPADPSAQLNAVFTVSLSRTTPAASSPISVVFGTANGTALAGGATPDYIGTSGTINFLTGEFQKSVTVAILGDALDEPDETFFVNLVSASSGALLADSQGQGTIQDEDPIPAVSIGDVVQNEGTGAASIFSFPVTLSSASGQQVRVPFSTANGNAASGSDYTATIGTLTFAAGETSKTINVTVTGDSAVELDEVFFVNLGTPINALVQDGQGQATIVDDEAQLSISDASVQENGGSAVFTLTLSKVVSGNVVVNFATANGTAVASSDYTATAGSLTFSPGQTTQAITVAVLDDVANEGNENFFVNLSQPMGATLIDNQGQATIVENDPPPGIFIGNASVTEGNAGTTNVVLNVSLSATSSQVITVNYGTSGVTATAGLDFIASGGALTYQPGEVTKQITVQVLGDAQPEVTETFRVVLSSPVNANLGSPIGTVTIVDNDPTPLMAVAADAGTPQPIRVYNSLTGVERFNFFPYGSAFGGGVRVAVADINNDGQQDIITVPGPGGGPQVRVFDGRTGARIASFFAWESTLRNGLTVATGDVNLDGRPDLIVGTEGGPGARLRVFSGTNYAILKSTVFSSSSPFNGGIRVAAGDVNGDGRADVILGNAPGNTPRVMAIDALSGATIRDLFAFSASFGGGVYVAGADVDNDGFADIIAGSGKGIASQVKVFSGANGATIRNFSPYGAFTGGVRVGSVDRNNDGQIDILTGAGPGGGPHVKIFDGASGGRLNQFFAYNNFNGGIFVGGGKSGNVSGSPQLAVGGQGSTPGASLTSEQLQPILAVAVDRWQAAGVDNAKLQQLREIDVRVADLADGVLGQAFPKAVYIDVNAAGHGWFIDATPDRDEEFIGPVAAGAAAGRMDLLSTVMHELGHVLGLDDIYDHDDEVMHGLLDVGTRRTPGHSASEAVFATEDWR